MLGGSISVTDPGINYTRPCVRYMCSTATTVSASIFTRFNFHLGLSHFRLRNNKVAVESEKAVKIEAVGENRSRHCNELVAMHVAMRFNLGGGVS